MTGIEAVDPSTNGDSDHSRDRIRRAAAELARERGVAGATIAAICKRSGLPVSSVYWHFEDKDGLFEDVIRSSFSAWLTAVPRWESTELTADALRDTLESAAHSLPAIPDFLRVGMQVLLEHATAHERARQAFIDVRAEALKMITAWVLATVSDDVPAAAADDLAILVMSFTDGLLVGSQVYPDWDADPYIDIFVGVFRQIVDRHRAASAG